MCSLVLRRFRRTHSPHHFGPAYTNSPALLAGRVGKLLDQVFRRECSAGRETLKTPPLRGSFWKFCTKLARVLSPSVRWPTAVEVDALKTRPGSTSMLAFLDGFQVPCSDWLPTLVLRCSMAGPVGLRGAHSNKASVYLSGLSKLFWRIPPSLQTSPLSSYIPFYSPPGRWSNRSLTRLKEEHAEKIPFLYSPKY